MQSSERDEKIEKLKGTDIGAGWGGVGGVKCPYLWQVLCWSVLFCQCIAHQQLFE